MEKINEMKQFGNSLLIQINDVIGNDNKKKQEFKDYLKVRNYYDKNKSSIAKLAVLLNYLFTITE